MSKGLTRFGWVAVAGLGLAGLGLVTSCTGESAETGSAVSAEKRLNQYAAVRLTTDTATLSERERQMIALLIEAARPMDDVYWQQAYGNRDSLLGSIADPAMRRLVELNYGPWDRLAGNEPLLAGVGPKPAGANLYPADITTTEFEVATDADAAASLRSLYTLVQRDAAGRLTAIPYHEAFRSQVETAAGKLREAAALAEDPGLARYLSLRADALLTDDYRASDVAWMDMKSNRLDIVIGPIETYEDGLFGYKAAYEAFVLVKDMAWSERLSRFAAFLPDLQRGLPVPDAYKREMPGTDADLNAYDVVYYAGEANAGAKTIAINLPNDETVQAEKGSRRLQLKNAMRAKFDAILVPLADHLIAEDQRAHVTFDAFFENVMFHEVAHGLGLNTTINGRGTVREALKEHTSALEEGKADVLGLYMVTWLRDHGHLTDGDLRDNYVTFLAGIFRSVRFGVADAHGRANMLQFHQLEDAGAFTYDEAARTYRVDFDRMRTAIGETARLILTLQGDGNYDEVARLLTERGTTGPALQADLDRLATAGIPVDIVFEQGKDALSGTRPDVP
jgi:hypothetical protein